MLEDMLFGICDELEKAINENSRKEFEPKVREAIENSLFSATSNIHQAISLCEEGKDSYAYKWMKKKNKNVKNVINEENT